MELPPTPIAAAAVAFLSSREDRIREPLSFELLDESDDEGPLDGGNDARKWMLFLL